MICTLGIVLVTLMTFDGSSMYKVVVTAIGMSIEAIIFYRMAPKKSFNINIHFEINDNRRII